MYDDARTYNPQISMSECRQNFSPTQNVSRGFLLFSTPSTQGTVSQRCHVDMSSQGAVSLETASNYPQFRSVKDSNLVLAAGLGPDISSGAYP